MPRSRIEDVLDVLTEIRKMHSHSGGKIRIDILRQEAIKAIAPRELQSSRFKNRDSAEKSIHDACSRRLKKIGNIYEFERAAKDWLNGYPNRLRVAVEFEIRNTRERQSVSNFFGDTSSIGDKLANEHINTPSTPVKIPPTPTPIASDIEEPSQPDRVKQETYRILRDTNLARRVKEEKKYKCEICDQSLELKEGRLYTEVHHIIPLGTPHNGPDVRGNILCVCPNHHVLLDYGAIKLDGEKLNSTDNKYVDYHNTHIYGKI